MVPVPGPVACPCHCCSVYSKPIVPSPVLETLGEVDPFHFRTVTVSRRMEDLSTWISGIGRMTRALWMWTNVSQVRGLWTWKSGVPYRKTPSVQYPPYLIWSCYGISLWDIYGISLKSYKFPVKWPYKLRGLMYIGGGANAHFTLVMIFSQQPWAAGDPMGLTALYTVTTCCLMFLMGGSHSRVSEVWFWSCIVLWSDLGILWLGILVKLVNN